LAALQDKTKIHRGASDAKQKTMSITPITISGKQFMCGVNRFMIRGVAMSADAVLNTKLQNIKDILSEEHSDFMLNEVIPQLVYLNANCIRVYQVDPNNSHSTTMNNLAANGIYVMVGLATSYNSVNQTTGDYSQATFVHAARVVDEFQSYDNTFCFSVGNEVEFPGQMAANIHAANSKWTSSEVVAATINLEYAVAQAMKSFARDIKKHIADNSYRTIPVGAAMQDGPESAWGSNNPVAYQQGLIGTNIIARYYTAGNASEMMDFIGINSYRYVTGNPADAAYSGLVTEASHYPVPVFLTESGGLPTPNAARDWKDVPTLYSSTDQYYLQLSGQIAFQMLEEGAGYGIYTVGGDSSLSPQFTNGASNLSAQFTAVAADTVPAAALTPVIPTDSPATMNPLKKKDPDKLHWLDLLPVKKYELPNATITLSNYASCDVLLTQQGGVIAKVQAAASAGPPIVPTSVNVPVLANSAIQVLGNSGTPAAPVWIALCGVPAASVTNGIVVATNVNWGPNQHCTLLGTLVSVTVENYSTTSSIIVVQNNNVMGVVAEAADQTTPATAIVAVTPGVQILIQGPAPTYASCCQVAASSVQAGITISNNVPSWGGGVSCEVN
jgi:Glucanosyltransferase